MEFLIDAGLGIVVQQVSYIDDKPASRYELRDVRTDQVIGATEFCAGIAPDLPVIDANTPPG